MANRTGTSLADELLAALPVSPDAYPQRLDLARARVLLVELNEAAYQSASFLDDRILSPATRGAWLPMERIAAAVQSMHAPAPLHYVFHTGHVGSTLVSRLLDTSNKVLSL